MGDIVAIGKFGRSMKFGRHLWKDGAGNNEPATLFSALANSNPDNLYVVVGKSDLSRCKQEDYDYWFPLGNVIDAWKGFNSKEDNSLIYPYEQVKHLEFDYGIMNGGITSEINTENSFPKYNKKTGEIDEEKIVKPLGMFAKGVGPILYFLNTTGIKWVNFTADARQFPIAAYDMFNTNLITFATINKKAEVNKFKEYGKCEIIKVEEEAVYGATECLCLLDPMYEGISHVGGDRDIKIGLFFHKYRDKKRIRALREYIDIFDEEDISVFGKWEDEFEAEDTKFKGSKTFDEMQEILPTIKYTLCYPITPGDISAKWIESIRAGIIPFFDKNYDADRILIDKYNIPEFLYTSNPQAFKNKIEYLESNPNEYEKIAKKLKNIHDNISSNLINDYNEMIKKVIGK